MNPLERLWHDKMMIYRWVEREVGGFTKNEEIEIAVDVKCKYSKGSLNDTGTEGVPTLVNSYTLFCGLDVDIQEGDKIIITQRNGKQIELSVGEGFPYSNHQEFSVKRIETA